MIAYLNQNANQAIINALAREGFEICTLTPFRALSAPTDTHADMLLCAVGDKIFKHAEYCLSNGDFTDISEAMGEKYPHDVLLNIAIVGKHAFCNTKFASKTVLEYLQENDFIIHHVPQGYAHCSTCIVTDTAIVTADKGIASAAAQAGIDVLQISEGYISLPAYEYGFIGGASGAYADKVYFCGSLKYHPDGERIREFIEKHGKSAVELCDAPLCDVGGILLI